MFYVETLFLTRLASASWSSLSKMLGTSNDGVNKEVMSSGRFSPVTLSVASEFGGEAGLAGWIGVSRFGYAVLFSKM